MQTVNKNAIPKETITSAVPAYKGLYDLRLTREPKKKVQLVAVLLRRP